MPDLLWALGGCTMSNVIDSLHQDHRNIARLLVLLEKQVDHFAAGEYTDFQIITDIMHYFMNFPDVYHHPHEEIIFATLKSKNINVADIIDEITTEHQNMAEESSAIYDAVKHIQGNAILSREEIVTRLRNYIANYYSHINREEEKLFELANSTLDKEDWQKIDTEVTDTDDPLFGKIQDREYQDLYKMILSEDKEPQRSEE